MFKKIMFATTASPSCDHAARVAFNIADSYESDLFVFHVLGIPSRGFSSDVIDSRTGEKVTYDDDYVQWVKEEMNNTYGELMKKSGKCTLEALAGIPHTEISRYARKNNIDLIVMGAHGKKDLTDRILGSISAKVSEKSEIPLLLIKKK